MAKRRLKLDQTLFDAPTESERRRLTEVGTYDGVPTYLLDVPETIPQLGYGSHQFFRYYGKFPSVVGREIVRRFAQPGEPILDCYAGSGTSLVEAQIYGCPSFGLDLNPLAVLACNVKTRYYDRGSLAETFQAVLRDAINELNPWVPSAATRTSKLTKWFTPQAAQDLGRLRAAVERCPDGPVRDFLTVAFLGIVRRCSNAYDGEVRPHINPEKHPRRPFDAFADKVEDMLIGLDEVNELRPEGVPSTTLIADSRDPMAYPAQAPVLTVAHPPYLNSFNYLPVFNLEFMWAEGLSNVWLDWSPAKVRPLEHVAWPATNSDLVTRYYDDFMSVAKSATSATRDGGILAVVVGDSTINGVLEPVHTLIWNRLIESGMAPVEIWYRTTHYGIGKYAYSHRADYHGAAEKKDAILFLRKVTGR